ncbi:TetR/AcrR family transcriptional regulator [Rhizobium mongolense]|uniref:TetR/AcrR family transcriptional repressor of nem operon n=2 Tax=Rhizobium mongolense TaxID=57676 RepID=A0ABR6IGK4_9HYPH|nr:TetR/AcrR family transcriptional regulator [Rhizobium mongolense]MBB4226981.1 TetR/AcrR family transcriptional repressor of nem operon [Rhizobium mongolense]TVZ74175.1 TetR family transcriptional regulator [Rhizobium mongolense USDA 1844]
MRITKEKYEENHERIVAIASEMFRERGFDGVSVAELMERAGLTHGGFYNHFRSKEDLIAEAAARGFGETLERYAGHDALSAIELYISRQHRDARGQGCPAAALSCEAARQPDETRSAFAAGIENLLRAFEGDIARNQPPGAGSRALAISLLAQAVGAVVLSRACPDGSSLADEILDACLDDCRDAIAAVREQ